MRVLAWASLKQAEVAPERFFLVISLVSWSMFTYKEAAATNINSSPMGGQKLFPPSSGEGGDAHKLLYPFILVDHAMWEMEALMS